MTTQSDWNPDRACEEMAELFNQANKIISQPHYQVPDASAARPDISSADTSPTTDINESQGLTFIMKPLGFYISAPSSHPDANVINTFEQHFGSYLQELSRDDKAAVQICLIEAATNTQQVFIQENFLTNENGGELWQMAQLLSPGNQLALSVALANFLAYGGQKS